MNWEGSKNIPIFNIKLFRILFIRPHLEFASSVSNVLSKEHIYEMECIQRKATKMVIEIRSLEYEERLRVLGLTTLEERRKRGDLIQIYKIVLLQHVGMELSKFIIFIIDKDKQMYYNIILI